MDSSYWVPKLDESSPATLTLKFDESVPVLEVSLELPMR